MKKRIIIVPLIFLFLVFLGFSVLRRMQYGQRYTAGGHIVFWVLYDYIQHNQGEFPASEKDLITQGFLRRSPTHPGEYEYRTNMDDDKTVEAFWATAYIFDEFEVAYGVNTTNIELKEGKLYDKTTRKPFFLFKACDKYSLPNFYMQRSVMLFEEMELLKQKTANSTKQHGMDLEK